ncbi:MAG TPA: hypothetical protein VN699_06485 [Pirellulales bacterium]|nr:hypothetical protein [Pirellulales bacterium]
MISAAPRDLRFAKDWVRYDEAAEPRETRRAVRFTATKTRRADVSPATPCARRPTEAILPPLGCACGPGMTDAISGFPQWVQAILQAMKKYRTLLAGTGGDCFGSGAPDVPRDDDERAGIKRVKGRLLEVARSGESVRQ